MWPAKRPAHFERWLDAVPWDVLYLLVRDIVREELTT